MPDVKFTDEDKSLAKEVATPIILRILRNFSAEDIAHAVKTDLNIVKWLRKNRRAFWRLKIILNAIPFVDGVAPYLKSKKVLKWCINNELQHKMPDLYIQFIYNPKAFDWLHLNMANLSDFLFD